MVGSDAIEDLRRFNRQYTRRFGLLQHKLDGSPFSLSEARILYELAQVDRRTAADLARALDLDPAQISRTVNRFIDKGLVIASPDPAHAKHKLLSLTGYGRKEFAKLEDKTRSAIGQTVDAMPSYRLGRLLAATKAALFALDEAEMQPRLRDLRAGDLGLVISRQAILYAREYGWNADYEALVARILADYHEAFDPLLDAAWIADLDGQMVGSIFLVHCETPGVGKLRLLYVEPSARGMGIGGMLVSACIERARAAGYGRVELWTNSVLTAARRLYENAGFRLIREEAHFSFGKNLVGQTWSLDLI